MLQIETHNLAIGYRRRDRELCVCDDINLSLAEGELTCLIGNNGTGKSTLLRTLSSMLSPLRGTVTLHGRPLADYSRKEIAREVGLVLTRRLEGLTLTVSEVVAMGRNPYTGFWGTLGKNDRAIVDKALADTGISSLADRILSTLSDGEAQKAMIAKTLAQQTPVILLDEPTAFLDYRSKAELMRLLQLLAHEEHKTIIASTHDLPLALLFADRWLLMEDKTITEKGKEEVKAWLDDNC